MNIDLDIDSLSPDQFKKFQAVDIREPEECEAFAPRTKNIAFIPLSQADKKMDYFKTNHSYLLVCAKGGRSHYLAEILQSKGIHALSVNHGMASFNQYLEENGYADS